MREKWRNLKCPRFCSWESISGGSGTEQKGGFRGGPKTIRGFILIVLGMLVSYRKRDAQEEKARVGDIDR